MPLYRFRLEAQDGSGHFRHGTTEAESEDAARVWLELAELQRAQWKMGDELAAELCEAHNVESIDALPAAAPLKASDEEKTTFRALPVRDRSYLNIHRQTKPYKLTKLEEVK